MTNVVPATTLAAPSGSPHASANCVFMVTYFVYVTVFVRSSDVRVNTLVSVQFFVQ